ncbi:two-component sensor histidine kinase [Bacillus mangrovi]|uniref:histidine kinase n=1 Tax=Metabacillus mangrovi TaxID=1491830 RepID=A0A7X2V5P8_9BACI|nr:ATP-binding protein [Metabacillus mangrovi]MTH54419.1 two-component sensor histidine kinase [Metabacillus mangrovi]
MKYHQIKWLILILPTVTIGLWEFVRHEYLLPYLSMDMGNLLSPVIVFAVTILVVMRLFSLLEKMQEELKQEKAKKAALLERENLARELHDGIAQSLFLLSVKLNQFGKRKSLHSDADYVNLQQILQHIHEDTRQAISSLKKPPATGVFSWQKNVKDYLAELEGSHSLKVDLQWALPEEMLTDKEKVEIFSCIKEAVTNVIKHAQTDHVRIKAFQVPGGWMCEIKDNGTGFNEESLPGGKGFGLQIMKNRAASMGWTFTISSMEGETKIQIQKEAERNAALSNIGSG